MRTPSLAALVLLAVVPVAAGGAEPAAVAKPAVKQRTVAVVLYDAVEILDFAGPTQVFAAAGNGVDDQEAFKVYTVGKANAPALSHGVLKITPTYSFEDAPLPDILVLPGGNSNVIIEDKKAMEWIGRATAKAEITMSVCTGAFILGKLGLLKGKTVTTWYGAVDRLRKAVPDANVQDGRRFVDNGRIITTAGVSAGIDGALHVVARLHGRGAADDTARYLEYRWTAEPYLIASYKR
jgi:transcriptional regulator GlxA family with amidase domain